MKNLFLNVLFALLLAGAPFGLPAAQAAPIQPTHAPRMSLIPAAAELGQQIQALVTGDENVEVEPQETFGTRALGLIITFFNVVTQQGSAFATNFADLPQLTAWLGQQLNDPVLYGRWVTIAQTLLIVVGGAFAAGWLAELLLLPMRRRIYRIQPETQAVRVGALFSSLFLGLVPVIVFVGGALALMNQGDPSKLVRYVVMTVVYGLALLRLIRLAVRFLLAPRVEALRLIPVTTPQAVYVQTWLSWISFVMVVGYFGVDVARLMRVPPGAIMAFSNFIGLGVVLMAVAIIIQKRSFVSSFLRGDLSAAQKRLSLWQSLRLWLARSWHVLAIAYLVIGYAVTTLGGGDGFAIMQRGTILTLLALLAMRMAFYLIVRMLSKPRHEETATSAGILRPVLRGLLKLATWGLGLAAIAGAWGADVPGFFASPWGQRIMGSLFTISSTLVIVVAIYESLHALIERRLNHRDAEGHVAEGNARARTLLPMLRNAAIIVLAVVVGLVTLSELGINIAPLLAGAGVLGVAIGFGSQTLVKDFLTGLFIILEDTIAVGDLVTIGEHNGVVEGISIRTVRLRDVYGSLHVLPFSEITRLINKSKGFSFAVMDLSVAYDSDLRHVMDVMREVGDELRKDPELKPLILEPIEIFGVETFADSSIGLRCRIKTQPGKQFDVKRAYMLRVKERFDAEKIEIPFPTVMQMQRG